MLKNDLPKVDIFSFEKVILGVKNIEFYDDLENVIYYSDFKGQKICYVPFFRFLVLIFILEAFLLL
jgi:hypothetical protein